MVVISAGNILSQTFTVWFRNFIVFNLLAVIAAAPILIYCYLVLSEGLTPASIMTLSIVIAIGSILVSNLVTGLVSYSTFKSLRGKAPGIGLTLSAGLSRIVPIFGTGLLVAIAIAIAFAPMLWMIYEETGLGALLTLVMIVPAVVVSIMLSLAVPIAAVEGVNPIAAVKRSVMLTKGSKGTIFGVLFAIGIIEKIASKVLEAVFISGIPTLDDVKIYLWAVVGLSILFMGLRGTAEAVAYHDIRTVREGVSTEDLASVFE